MVPQILVAVLSDDRLFCEGLSHIIGAEGVLSLVGPLGVTVFGAAVRSAAPHVLLVDSRLPDAVEKCAALKRERGPAVIFFMADGADTRWAVEALSAGARGILAREAVGDELIKAIKVVRDGQIWARRNVVEAWAERMAVQSATARSADLEQGLSDREREVFRHAAAGLTNKELARRLGISEGTVKVHLSHIFQKLGLRGRSELAAAYHGIEPTEGGVYRAPLRPPA